MGERALHSTKLWSDYRSTQYGAVQRSNYRPIKNHKCALALTTTLCHSLLPRPNRGITGRQRRVRRRLIRVRSEREECLGLHHSASRAVPLP
ncbi:hypothetical protein EVAR_60443_1 [Eumeta japonica]|uniref:Uncharacterized protein n=1 Tax=Eumeta variegata TaxID=151549 RepID=A0A4C1YX29_EUMVA|nr:hypothetical protein EVAR_60443_1 [Eumeta japonica]